MTDWKDKERAKKEKEEKEQEERIRRLERLYGDSSSYESGGDFGGLLGFVTDLIINIFMFPLRAFFFLLKYSLYLIITIIFFAVIFACLFTFFPDFFF